MGEYLIGSGTKLLLGGASGDGTRARSAVDISHTNKDGSQQATAAPKLPYQPSAILRSSTGIKKTVAEVQRSSLTRGSPNLLVVQDRENAKAGPGRTLRLYQVREGAWTRSG